MTVGEGVHRSQRAAEGAVDAGEEAQRTERERPGPVGIHERGVRDRARTGQSERRRASPCHLRRVMARRAGGGGGSEARGGARRWEGGSHWTATVAAGSLVRPKRLGERRTRPVT